MSQFAHPDRRADFLAGVREGAPIGAGYLAVSIAVGLLWAQAAYPPIAGMVMSAGSMSSTGSFAAISVMVADGALLELAAATAVVNLRYVLMSLALSQRLEPGIGTRFSCLAMRPPTVSTSSSSRLTPNRAPSSSSGSRDETR